MPLTPDSPFHLDNTLGYHRWREQKLAQAPGHLSELWVDIRDPLHLTTAEIDACHARIRRCNAVLYASTNTTANHDIPLQLGTQLGLRNLDANWLADEDGISAISVHPTATRVPYIPYTNRPIKWHTDGYYNPPDRLIRSMILHCVCPAQSGGSNRLMDPEMAYIQLRDQSPEHIHALMQRDTMTIPQREGETSDRPAQTGPVFSFDAEDHLHMRYTARTHSIHWKQDDQTLSAVKALESLLVAPDNPAVFEVFLEAGAGLLCNNVLHDRSGFTDDPNAPRLLYRARYLERIRAV
ncbi:MAG: taurine catabolism dioxygenase TauD [Ferrovum sp.]|nr:taurine catabolism dioxygenase TauD [Ferrovum sp.]